MKGNSILALLVEWQAFEFLDKYDYFASAFLAASEIGDTLIVKNLLQLGSKVKL